MSARILVTGATGFVGGRLCAELVARGHVVRALARRPHAAGATETIVGDLADPASLARAVDGVDVVVHLAARVHVMRDTAADPAAEFRRLNVDATRRLADEAAAHGVRRFVFASSVKAVAESATTVLHDDAVPCPVDPYGQSKLAAERAVLALRDASFEPVVARLPLVYGPGMRANMLRLFDAVARRRPLPFGGIDNRRSLVFVGNAAAALAGLATTAAPVAGDAFFVSDGADLSSAELARAIAAALGVAPRIVPMPLWALRGAAHVGDVLARVAPFPLTTAAVDRLVGSLAVDSSRLWRRLGAPPPYDIAHGMAETARWYRARAEAT